MIEDFCSYGVLTALRSDSVRKGVILPGLLDLFWGEGEAFFCSLV